MNIHLHRFGRVAAQVSQGRHPNFFDKGLRDFILDVGKQALTPEEIAAKALTYFCLDDGGFNGFVTGIVGVMQFLRESGCTCQSPQQAFQDLKAILDQKAVDQIGRWLQTWYR